MPKAKPVGNDTAVRSKAQMTAQAAALLSEGSILASFQHKGVVGIEREEPVRRFLRSHLPGRFHVGQGSIASSKIILDTQHDIVVANRDTCFMLLNTVAAQLTTIESLHMIVEVRTDFGDITDVAKSLLKVRGLEPMEGIYQNGKLSTVDKTPQAVHTLIAYEGPTKETSLEKLAKVNALQQTNGGRFPIDYVLVLSQKDKNDPDSGYLIGYGRTDAKGNAFHHHYYPMLNEFGIDGPRVIEEGADSFAYWYAAILNHLSGVTAYPPNLYAYLGRPQQIVAWDNYPN